MLLTTVCIVFLLIGGAAEAGAPPPPTVEYVVESGDTLWAIASTHTDPGKDIRVTVAEIIELSGVDDSSIRPGQVLRVPRG
ncbi:MAG: LysM peptidoglycan-binding domain-containing protein [Actinobacteria bacterium]|nr:LysM peptidoglycan-binding domain-containing protein [Actinomycetota bacterium]